MPTMVKYSAPISLNNAYYEDTFRCPHSFLHIKCRVHIVYIFLIELFPQQFDGFSEALEVDNLPLPEELDGIIDIRVIRKPQDVVIGDPSLLLWERIP